MMRDGFRTLVLLGVLCGVVAVTGFAFSFVYPLSMNEHDRPQGTYAAPSFTEPYETEETLVVTESGKGGDEYLQNRVFAVEGTEILEVHHYDDTGRERVIDTVHYTDTDEQWRTTQRQTNEEGTMDSWVEDTGADRIVSQEADGDRYSLITAYSDEETASDHLHDFYHHPLAGWKYYGPDYEYQEAGIFENRIVEVMSQKMDGTNEWDSAGLTVSSV